MGQYYTAVIKNEKTGKKIGRFTYGLKLMEHSWWFNAHMGAICKLIHNNPSRVAWVGDYADESDDWLSDEDRKYWYEFAWKTRDKRCVKETSKTAPKILLDDKFLVNHDQKIFINCNKYRQMNERDDWCIHPLSLLTAKGNGRGGGDYHDKYPCFDDVGSWCTDLIEITDSAPDGYSEVEYNFVEE